MRTRIFRAAGPGLAAMFVLGAGASLSAQDTTGAGARKTVTLDQAVQLTLEHSPDMVQAQGTVRNAQGSRLAAVGGFLPSLSLTSGA